jgi:hypothetical protein
VKNSVNQGSISPTFYEQLLPAQIPKVQKCSQVVILFALLVSAHEKAAHKMLVKLTPERERVRGKRKR